MKIKEIIKMLDSLTDEQKERELVTDDGFGFGYPTRIIEIKNRKDVMLLD